MDYGVFTLSDTNTNKMGLQPNCTCVGGRVGVCVSVGQREHLNTFFIGVCVGTCVGQCEHSTNWTKLTRDWLA